MFLSCSSNLAYKETRGIFDVSYRCRDSVCCLPNYPQFLPCIFFFFRTFFFSLFLFHVCFILNRKLHSSLKRSRRLLSLASLETHVNTRLPPPILLQSIRIPGHEPARSGSAARPDPDEPGFARSWFRLRPHSGKPCSFLSCQDSAAPVLICSPSFVPLVDKKKTFIGFA